MAKIKNINFNNFRNFKKFKTSFDNKLNILFGDNGSGKTNILEAISLVAKGRGIRNSILSNLIKNNEENFYIKKNLEIKKNFFDVEIFTEKKNEKLRKVIKVNNNLKKDSIDYLNQSVSFLTFTPEMERLFQSSPVSRRNFIDRLIFSGRNNYNKLINRYKKILVERITILQKDNYDIYWLNQIEKDISITGLEIYKLRNDQLKLLNRNIKKLNNAKNFVFNIDLYIKDNFYYSELNVDKYINCLVDSRYYDKINGVTKLGPHRSDIKAKINSEFDASLLSTGQQKTLVLLILLSQCFFLINDKNLTPILLFDEIASHLDSFNRQLLLDLINGFDIQFFLTGTDKDLFSFVSTNAEFYNISNI